MAHKRIGVDVDGVLAQFTDAFSGLIVQTTGRDLFPPRPFDPPCWHYPQHYGYTHAELSEVWAQIADSRDFWFTLEMMSGVSSAYSRLLTLDWNGEHDVYFLTDRKGSTARRQTELWLDRHSDITVDIMPTVLITDNKPYAAIALHLDVLIDDYHANTREMALAVPACRTYLLNRSYNQDQFAGIDVVRVDTLEQMFEREQL